MFQIEEDSEPDRLNFKSNLFGNLGAGMFSGPNKIDFSTVFDNFGAKLVENMPVVATVIGVILLYFVGVFVCRRLDKADAFKVTARVLDSDNTMHPLLSLSIPFLRIGRICIPIHLNIS